MRRPDTVPGRAGGINVTWYEKIIAAHVAVTDAVSHYERMKSDRYFVWQEDGANDLEAESRHAERVVAGSTDLYTKQEFDPWIEALNDSFDAHEIAWGINSVQYEEETGYIHVEWVWEVCGDSKDDH